MEEIKKEPVTVLFILLNILIFVIVDFTGGSENTVHMIACGAAYPPLILEEGETYRLFTCMFLHFGIYHIANNMLVLFVLGQRLEPVLGKVKFILVYLLGGLGGNIFSLLMETKKAEYAVSARRIRRSVCGDGSNALCSDPKPRTHSGHFCTSDDDYGRIFPVFWLYKYGRG